MRFLVIDDEPTARADLAPMLARWGRVDAAASAAAGVELARSAAAVGDPYALICVDLCMPEADGIAALDALRCLEEQPDYARAQVVMVTASDQTADVLEAFRHQADAYLIKPVHEDRLEGIVERVMPMGELR